MDKKIFYNKISEDSKEFYLEFINLLCPCFSKYVNNYATEISEQDDYNISDSSNETIEDDYQLNYQSVISKEPNDDEKLWVFVEN